MPERRRHGVRYVTDERVGEGTVGAFSVATNLVLKEIGAPPFWRRGLSDWDRIHDHARGQIRRNDIRTPSEKTPVGQLSGGNIQKVLLARELECRCRRRRSSTSRPTASTCRTPASPMSASSPAPRAGLATIVISTDLDELLELSDRIGVMFQGQLAGIVDNGPDVERRSAC